MSLYSAEEVCTNCENAVFCEKCGSFEYCRLEIEHSAITGKCDQKKKR